MNKSSSPVLSVNLASSHFRNDHEYCLSTTVTASFTNISSVKSNMIVGRGTRRQNECVGETTIRIHAECECAARRETAKRRVAGITGSSQNAVANPANTGLRLALRWKRDMCYRVVSNLFLKEAVLHPVRSPADLA